MFQRTRCDKKLIGILALILALAGCGSSGGGGSGGGGSPTSNVPPLSQQVLYDSASDVAAHISALMTTGTTAGDVKAITDYLQSKPEIADVAVNDDNSVLAHYTDGTALIVFSNRRPDGSVAMGNSGRPMTLAGAWNRVQTQWSGFTRQVGAALIPSALAANGGFVLPQGKVALSLNVLGYGGSASSLFLSALNSKGYNASEKAGTVADFRAVNAINNYAVLYISSHGALVNTSSPPAYVPDYAIGTGELFPSACTDPACDANTADRMAGLLTIAVFPDKAQPYYAIRSAFVKTYWHLAPNAVVFLDACGSMFSGPLEDAMRQAIKGAGAVSIVGWTSPVSISGAPVVFSYLFDRVLGANSYQPESPPQRPFSIPEVIDYMASQGVDKDPTPKDPSIVAQLKLVQYGQDASILVPSIKNMEMQENDARVIVYGEFGSVPGTIKIDTEAGVPSPWTNDALLIDLPINGAGSSGPVVVYGPDGQMSNAAPLTEFNGTMKLTRTLDTTMGAPGFTDVADCSLLHFRADVHSYRSAPGVTPTDGGGAIDNFASNIKCTWTMTGADAIRVIGDAGTDSGTLPWVNNTNQTSAPPSIDLAMGTVVGGATPGLIMNIDCAADAKMKVTDPLTGNVTTTNGPMMCMYGTETTGTLPLQSDYSLPEQTFSIATFPPGSKDTLSLRIHFSTVSPPDDKTQQ